MPPGQSNTSSNRDVISLVVVFLALLIVVYLIQGTFKDNEKAADQVSQPEGTKENVIVRETNLNEVSGRERLPIGFPTDVPVDTSAIVESFSANYPDRGVTQSTVSFSSNKSQAALFSEYATFMTNTGYDFGQSGKNENLKTLFGTKDGNDLLIVFPINNSVTSVQITYVERK